MNNVVFLLDDVGPMLELCLNDVGPINNVVFLFLIFLNFVLLKPNFDQDLNKSKTSK